MSDWIRDGHTVEVLIDFDTLCCRVKCPGQGRCESPGVCHTCIDEHGLCMKQVDPSGRCECGRCGGTCREPEWYCNVKEWLDNTDTAECHERSAQPISNGDRIEYRWINPDGPEWRVVTSQNGEGDHE